MIALDVALGLGDYYDVGALYSDERASADFYSGCSTPASASPPPAARIIFRMCWLDPPPGSPIALTRASTGPLTIAGGSMHQAWPDVLFDRPDRARFEVEGRGPGEEIAMRVEAPSSLRVVADVASIAPLDSVEVLVNGEVARTVRATDPRARRLRARRAAARRLGGAARERSKVAIYRRRLRVRLDLAGVRRARRQAVRDGSGCDVPRRTVVRCGREWRSRAGGPTPSATRSRPPSIVRRRCTRNCPPKHRRGNDASPT